MKRKRVPEAKPADGQPPKDGPSFSKVDEPTLQYFKEIKSHLDDASDQDQQSAIASNALLEAKDKEAILGSDPVCSRIIEALIPLASHETAETFAARALGPENFVTLASSPCGSHVAERLFEALIHDRAEKAHQVLVSAAETLAARLYEFSTDRFGSHVARALVGLAAGVDLQNLQGGSKDAPSKMQRADSKVQKGLVAKVGFKRSRETSGNKVDKQILAPILGALLQEDFQGTLAEELPFHQYGSPFLQTVLLASQENEEFLSKIIPRILGSKSGDPVEGFATLQVEDIHGLMQDRTSSHLMEVMMSVAPPSILEQLEQKVFRNHLAWMAMDPVANFVLQALLGSITKSPQLRHERKALNRNADMQMKAAVKELRGSFPTLLRSKRGGVISAALSAAARTSTGQVDLSKALSAALRELPGNQQGPAAALLTLDQAANLDGQALKKRLSTLGCTILTAVFAFVKEGSSEFLDSFLELSPQQLAIIAADPGGSRVMEALLETPSANAKAKKKLLKKLSGYYGAISSTPSGNFLVEKCYGFAGVKDKEAIAEDLAKAEGELAVTPRGMKLLLRCQVSEFKRNSESWRKHVKSREAIQKDFADLLLSPTAKASADTNGTAEAMLVPANGLDKPKKKPKTGTFLIEAEQEADQEAAALAAKAKRKKKAGKGEKHAEAVSEQLNPPPGPGHEAPGEGKAIVDVELQDGQLNGKPEVEKKEKKRKKKKEDKAELPEEVDMASNGEATPTVGIVANTSTSDGSHNNANKKSKGKQSNKLKPAKARSHWKSKAKPSPGPLKEGQEKTKEPTGGTTPILEEASKDGVLTTLQVFEDLPPKKGKKPKGKKQKAAALSNAKKMKKLKKMKKKQEKVVNKRPRKAKWVNAKLRRQAEKAKAAAS